MVEFPFTVNESFLATRLHPITVPRRFVDYAELRAQGLSRGPVEIYCPNGRSLAGIMYSGTAGYGPYYQIKADGYSRDPLYDLQSGTRLRVRLERADDGVHVYLAVHGSE